MTNEEKAIELYRTRYLKGEERKKMHERRIGFVQGAEWKDQQFKEYLEKKREQVATTGQVCLIDEIINELFGEE